MTLAEAAVRGREAQPTDNLTTAEVAEILNVPVATLRWWRHEGNTGPKSFRLGPRAVRYRRADVTAWLEAQYAAATSEPA